MIRSVFLLFTFLDDHSESNDCGYYQYANGDGAGDRNRIRTLVGKIAHITGDQMAGAIVNTGAGN